MKLRKCSHIVPYWGQMEPPYGPHPREETEYGRRTHWMNYRIRHRQAPTADDFGISMREAFALAEKEVPSIVVRRNLVGGNPCIKGTRIPVYMILDGVEYYGNLKGVLKSYPQLTAGQVKDAVRFSKIAINCYVEP